jgi:hypothetical protein
MIHARTIEAAKKIAIELSNFVGINEYKILFSSREFKKERVNTSCIDIYSLSPINVVSCLIY